MRWGDLAHAVRPVNSHRTGRIETSPPVPVPDVGRRWGRPSAFSFSREEREEEGGPSVDVRWPGREPRHFMRIIPADLKVTATRHTVDDGSGNSVEIDRLNRMMFQYTEILPKPHVSSLQPSRTTYYDMTFALHPEEE